jgi:PAS domain S-box-containing protein
VTRRELAEEALKDRATQFRLFFEESFDATILMERSGVIDCNQAALDMLQLRSKAEIIGRTLWEISDQDSGDPLITLARTDHVMKSVVRKKRLRFEWTFRRHNGEVFPAEVTMTATRLKGKKILFMVVRDVTALKGAQRAMMITKEDLERRVKERTKAVTDANRELRKRTSELTDVNRKLKESREELRHLHEHLNAAREEEKTALAREVHDGLGHFLMGLKMELSYMKKGLMPDSPIAKQAASMEEQIDQALGVVSQICSDLRPHVLDQLGLLSAVEWYVEGFEKKTGIRCTTRVPAGSPQVKKEQAIVLFRVLQETMANVLRHSGATMVQVSLKEKGESMLLRVEDNGRGITKEEVSDPQSFGIIGIRERVRFWGGRSAFRGVKDGGTTVTVSIPLAGIRGGSPRKAEPRQRARGAL